jgi:uncharacterized protein
LYSASLSKLALFASFDNEAYLYDMRKLVERTTYMNKLVSYQDKDIIKVVTGLRRSGKSTLLSLFQNRLLENEIMPSQIQFYNFELPENFLNKTWDTLYFEIKAKLQADKKNYIFLDEIQNIV